MVFISKFLFTCVAEKPKKSSVGSSPSSTRPATRGIENNFVIDLVFDQSSDTTTTEKEKSLPEEPTPPSTPKPVSDVT